MGHAKGREVARLLAAEQAELARARERRREIDLELKKRSAAVRDLSRRLERASGGGRPRRATPRGDVVRLITEFLAERPGGAKCHDVVRALEGAVPASTVRDRLSRMAAEGGPLVAKPAHGGALYSVRAAPAP